MVQTYISCFSLVLFHGYSCSTDFSNKGQVLSFFFLFHLFSLNKAFIDLPSCLNQCISWQHNPFWIIYPAYFYISVFCSLLFQYFSENNLILFLGHFYYTGLSYHHYSNIYQTGFPTSTPVKHKLISNTAVTHIFWKWKYNCASSLLKSFLVPTAFRQKSDSKTGW